MHIAVEQDVCHVVRGYQIGGVVWCRPLITETLIPEQADEEDDKLDEHKSFAETVHGWVSSIFDRGNKTEIEMVLFSHTSLFPCVLSPDVVLMACAFSPWPSTTCPAHVL